MILPEPVKIFHSLANIWNQLLPQHHIDIKSLINVIRHDVYIRAYKLKTAEINLGKNGTQVGFKGYIQLIIKKSESPQKPLLPLLLKFGEEMNIGRYRTVGMGQIQVRKLN